MHEVNVACWKKTEDPRIKNKQGPYKMCSYVDKCDPAEASLDKLNDVLANAISALYFCNNSK